MRKFIARFRRWKAWIQYSKFNRLQNVLVLLKLKRCDWFESFCNWSYDGR